jgi:tetrahydromethanopterin S-methyltransferase subunit G
MATESQTTRLDRIEEKLDKLGEAMVSIARAEEKLIAMEQKHAAQYDRMNKFSEKLDNIEKIVQQNTNTVELYNKVVGAAVLAAVGAWASQYFM